MTADGDNPDVSVVIPVYDDYDTLDVTLRALEQQSYPANGVEVIVVDNGTPRARRRDVDDEYDLVRQISESTQGSYAARNAGVEAAEGELLAFTDADCRPDPDWLTNGIEALEGAPQVGLVGGALEIVTSDDGFNSADGPSAAEVWEMSRGFPQQHYIDDLNFAATANMLTRRAVFEDVGLFNEALLSGGDREWGERVAEAGYELVYEAEALVRHPARRDLKSLLKKHVRTTRGDYQRRNKRGELSDVARLIGILEGAGELAISPAKCLWVALTAGGDGLERRAKFAWADTLVDATRSLVAIEQLAGQLFAGGSEAEDADGGGGSISV